MEKGDPEMYALHKEENEIKQQTIKLAVQYRRAPAQQKPAVKKELQESVGAHFEVRQKRRQLELKRLEEELKRLSEAIERRTEMRKALIEKRVAELLGEESIDF